MSKRKSFDDFKDVQGPFNVDDMRFTRIEDDDDDLLGFTDDDVQAAMNDADRDDASTSETSWLVEEAVDPIAAARMAFEAQREAHERPEPVEPTPPPPPPAPAPEAPSAPEVDESLYIQDEPDRRRGLGTDNSGLVMEFQPETPQAPAGSTSEVVAETAEAALSWVSLLALGAVVGLAGAIVMVLILTSGGPETPPPPAPTMKVPQEMGAIKVRRSLQETPEPGAEAADPRPAEGEAPTPDGGEPTPDPAAP